MIEALAKMVSGKSSNMDIVDEALEQTVGDQLTDSLPAPVKQYSGILASNLANLQPDHYMAAIGA